MKKAIGESSKSLEIPLAFEVNLLNEKGVEMEIGSREDSETEQR